MTGNPELTRRGWLGLLGAAGGLTALGAAEVATGIPSDDWTVLALPATQFYAENLDGEIEYAHDQTRWDADHVGAEDVAFVTHEGDLVEDGGRGEEWDRIAAVMDRLDGRVPYSTPPGNHDWANDDANHQSKDAPIGNFRAHFGETSGRYDGKPWFGGFGPDGGPEREPERVPDVLGRLRGYPSKLTVRAWNGWCELGAGSRDHRRSMSVRRSHRTARGEAGVRCNPTLRRAL